MLPLVRRAFLYYPDRLRDIGTIPGKVMAFTDIDNAGYITATGSAANFPVRLHLIRPNVVAAPGLEPDAYAVAPAAGKAQARQQMPEVATPIQQ